MTAMNKISNLAPKISVRGLNFFYGDTLALKNVTLPLHSNNVTSFIGPSGCGKSTLLRVMNRMYDLYPRQRAEGEVLLDGENILKPEQDLNILRSRVGMVFQKPTPFPMSIYDNIAFGVRLYEKVDKAELDHRVEAALRHAALWTEVKDKLKASGLSLSGGQQQRLCIARTIALYPEVILLDEPCSALDPISTAKIEELIDELKENIRSPSLPIICSKLRAAPITLRSCILANLLNLASHRTFLLRQIANRRRIILPADSAERWRGLSGQLMSEHIVAAYDKELEALGQKIAEMGGIAEKMLSDAMDSLIEFDTKACPGDDQQRSAS